VLVAKAFCFVITFIFLIAKSKRIGGLGKHDQANGLVLYALFAIAIVSKRFFI